MSPQVKIKTFILKVTHKRLFYKSLFVLGLALYERASLVTKKNALQEALQ